MKSVLKAVTAAAFAVALGSSAQAATVTWGVNAQFDSYFVSGTVTFDDTTVQGFYDGIIDPNDTHVAGDFVLSSGGLGWVNVLFSGVTFQPYYYSDQNDGPHADYTFSAGGWNVELNDFNAARLTDVSGNVLQNGEWGLDRGQRVPEPASLALLAVGLLAVGARRKA